MYLHRKDQKETSKKIKLLYYGAEAVEVYLLKIFYSGVQFIFFTKKEKGYFLTHYTPKPLVNLIVKREDFRKLELQVRVEVITRHLFLPLL